MGGSDFNVDIHCELMCTIHESVLERQVWIYSEGNLRRAMEPEALRRLRDYYARCGEALASPSLLGSRWVTASSWYFTQFFQHSL